MTAYPEHEKLKALNGANNRLGEFLEWLQAGGREVCRIHTHTAACGGGVEFGLHQCGMREGHYYADPIDGRIETLLAEYFEIDMQKLSDEQEQMYRELVAANAALVQKLVAS